MKILMTTAAIAAALSLGACEGMAPGGYGDMPDDPLIADAGAAIPQLPPKPGGSGMPTPPSMPKPPGTSFPSTPAPPTTGGPSQTPRPPTAPTPTTGQTTGGPSQMPKPPTANPPAPPRVVICQSPQIMLRTEVPGAVEMKCGLPPDPLKPPSSLKCTSPEQITFYQRNGIATFECMK